MTKPIIVVKVPCKLLYVIQVKEFLIKCSTSWPYLISEFLVAYITIVASDWPRTFFTPKVFCLACNLTKIHLRTTVKVLCQENQAINLMWLQATAPTIYYLATNTKHSFRSNACGTYTKIFASSDGK